MAIEKNILDKWLKARFASYKEEQVGLSWADMETAILAAEKKKRKVIYFWKSGAAIFLALLIGGFYLLWDSRNDQDVRNQLNEIETKKENSEQFVKETKILKETKEKVLNNQRVNKDKISINPGGRNIIIEAFNKTKEPTNIENKKLTSKRSKVLSTVEPKRCILNFDYTDHIVIPTKAGWVENPIVTEKNNSWELGFSASPAFAKAIIAKNGAFKWLVNEKFMKIDKSSVNAAIGYQVAIGLNRYINKHVFVGLGVTYLQRQESVSYDHTIKQSVEILVTEKKLRYLPRPEILWEKVNYDGINTYHFIQIPIKFGTIVPLSRKINWQTELGVNYSYFAGVKGYKVDPSFLTLDKLKNDNRHNALLSIESGLFIKYNNKYQVGLVPYYQRMLTSIKEKDFGINEKPYILGLNVSFKYKLFTLK